MLIVSDGKRREVVSDLDSASSAFVSCVATLANVFIGVRPHVPGASERSKRIQLLASDVYAPGVGVSREIASLPAPRILHVYDVDTGEPARRPGSAAATVVLSLDRASVTSAERLHVGGATFELTVRQFVDAPDRASVATVIELRRTDGGGDAPRRLRLDYGIDALAVNEYLGTSSWLTARHYNLERCHCESDGFSIIAAVAGQRLRYDVIIRRSPPSASASATWEHPGPGCTISTTFDFSNADRHRIDAHWKLGSGSASWSMPQNAPPFDPAVAEDVHRTRWAGFWEDHGVTIEARGEPVELGIRYAVFQLLQHGIASHRHPRGFVSPARGLTSTYHSGATFFDTELHKCVFWIWNDPRVARALIDYRYHRLEQAIEFAKSTGFSGARFPEASNDRGTENGPHYVLSYPDAKTTREWSVDEVLHISADVCYALHCYREVTGDDAYMTARGYRIIAECARFAASAFEWSDSKQAYVVNSVMGPDEYHYHVDNSFFTNYLLRWCIRLAISSAEHEAFPDVPKAELDDWLAISDRVYLPWMSVGGVSIPEEFEGYAKLPDTELRITKKRGPQFVDESERESAEALRNFTSKIVKQADVILLMSLFPDDFPDDVKRAAFAFYEPRTVHESSLSYGPHAMVAADIGKTSDCADFIARASRYNLDFTPTADYGNGLHLSAYAGAWQGLVQGLAGLRIERGRLCFRPRLSPHWDAYRFAIHFRGRRLKVTVPANGTVRVECDGNALPTQRSADGRVYVLGGIE
ncbi:glycosyl hydrolase family 65 protein [Burkholderia mayonis]|uniref:glycosyl hydrolase family 65 protein n=1 Tax=Burkholderia mayonis TaxID=1385591 RepID=UPI000A560551|nr:glycosyl hydrolase family 65 protein [Burkholderia mayonis]